MHEHTNQTYLVALILKSFYLLADKKIQWPILYSTVVVIAALFGVAFWIAVGVVVSKSSKSGLLVNSFLFFILVTRYLPGSCFTLALLLFQGNPNSSLCDAYFVLFLFVHYQNILLPSFKKKQGQATI